MVNYPTSLDNLTNPTSGDYLNSPSHADQHANANDIIEALEAKVGANNSAVTTSHDYKLSGVTGSDKAASLAGSETLSNKTHNGDFKLAGATDNIQVNSADPYRTIIIPAAAMSPTTTSGCAVISTVEAGTNDIDYKVLDFDQSTQENAFFWIDGMPNSWDAGTLLISFEWTASSGSGDVIWGIKGRSYANDDAIDQAEGTAQEVTDTLTATGDVCITSETSALTLAGTPAGGQPVFFKVYRKAADASDTLSGDARLKAVRIRYKVAQYSD